MKPVVMRAWKLTRLIDVSDCSQLDLRCAMGWIVPASVALPSRDFPSTLGPYDLRDPGKCDRIQTVFGLAPRRGENGMPVMEIGTDGSEYCYGSGQV